MTVFILWLVWAVQLNAASFCVFVIMSASGIFRQQELDLFSGYFVGNLDIFIMGIHVTVRASVGSNREITAACGDWCLAISTKLGVYFNISVAIEEEHEYNVRISAVCAALSISKLFKLQKCPHLGQNSRDGKRFLKFMVRACIQTVCAKRDEFELIYDRVGAGRIVNNSRKIKRR